MRKQIIAPLKYEPGIPYEAWLNLEDLATVQVTSEENGYPIESAFIAEGIGWRAARSGVQTIRLVFDQPQPVRRIWLLFEETENARTQEFVLRWSQDRFNFREILRQQWSFSSDTAREIENYKVDLPGTAILELIIVPDNRGGDAKASLAKLLLA
jgi:hypothetical protein